MKKVLTGLLLVILTVGVSPTYAKCSDGVKVQINKAVTTKGIKIEFVELIEDSRCPRDAQCIWAGNAKIKVRISTATGTPELHELNTTTVPQSIVVGRYEIKLTALTPEPASNIRIRKDGYVATFGVTRRS